MMVALAVMQQAERGLAYDTDRHALAVTVVVHRKAHDAADRLTGPKAGHTFVQLDAQRHRGHLHDAISGAAQARAMPVSIHANGQSRWRRRLRSNVPV